MVNSNEKSNKTVFPVLGDGFIQANKFFSGHIKYQDISNIPEMV